ncbi:MAG: ribonuclease H-like YkuK family protein, partial [Brevinematia bacterium]
CVFATVVVIHHLRSRGANVFVKIDKTERIKSMKQRIMMEVSKAIETAISISNLVPTRPIEIHLDINTSSKFISNSIIKEAFGYVTAQGFKPVFKPESFAAYCVADYACKKYY